MQGAEGERLQMQIDSEKAHLTIQGTPCRLTEQEFQLLYVLAEKANQILSRDELLRTVWGFVTPCPTRTVDVHIKRLREKLPDCEQYGWKIHTVYRVGYKFEYKAQ